MTVQKERIRSLNSKKAGEGPVVYWMDRDRRIDDNWALLYAQQLSIERNVDLKIVFVIPDHFYDSGWRQHFFMIEGLKEVAEKAASLGVSFEMSAGKPADEVLGFCDRVDAGEVVVDFSPLKVPRSWRDQVAKKIEVSMCEVDAHNIVPCWVASPKKEFGAYTIRPKINRLLEQYLVDFPKVKKMKGGKSDIDWEKIEGSLRIDRKVEVVDWIEPGEKAARKAMNEFIEERIQSYGELRNDPNADAQSDLSPYLHFGQLSAQRLALEVQVRVEEYADEFLEELIVRRELADNFCFYNPSYDAVTGFPDWAKKTLDDHRDDPRDHLYTKKQFEEAKTHEDLWNAAQMELVKRGKLHGYMRMYWCKKIYEWSESSEEAMKIAIYLNDKYSLDGCDPNGYTGIAWSIGGVHDRAWASREVFGKIRYMNLNGCKRKFDVQAYIEKWM